MNYQGVNERTDERTGMFWSKEELESYIESIAEPGDFWDILCDGQLAYYFRPFI